MWCGVWSTVCENVRDCVGKNRLKWREDRERKEAVKVSKDFTEMSGETDKD